MSNDKKILFQKRYGNDLSNSLIAGWQFQNNLNDVKGVYTGTSSGGVGFATGINGQCAEFTGAFSSITFGDDDIFTFTNGTPFSIDGWINIQSLGTNLTNLLAKRDLTSTLCEWQLAFSITNNRWQFNKFSGGTSANFQQIGATTGAPTLNTWYHIAYTDAGTGNINDCKIYVNGIDVTASRTTIGTFTNMTNTTAEVRTGRLPWQSSGLDKKDEIMIRNIELTSTQVLYLYNSGLGKFYPTF